MRDLTARLRSRVNGDPIAALSNTFLARHLGGDFQEPSSGVPLRGAEGGERLDVLSGDDQHVHRSARMNVSERHDLLVLVDELAWQFPTNNPAEDTGFGH